MASLVMLLVKMKLLLVLFSVLAAARCQGHRRSQHPDAIINIVPGVDRVYGTLYLHRTHYGSILITGQIMGLTPGQHGFHVHEKGDLSDMCTAAAGHFNPFGARHGAPTDSDRHAGDLGNVNANNYGIADIYIEDRQISLDPYAPTYIGGLAMVVHQGRDDLGRGGNEESKKTGNAGKRSGCGIIEPVGNSRLPPGY